MNGFVGVLEKMFSNGKIGKLIGIILLVVIMANIFIIAPQNVSRKDYDANRSQEAKEIERHQMRLDELTRQVNELDRAMHEVGRRNARADEVIEEFRRVQERVWNLEHTRKEAR
jgi:uncharacterized protein YlxW (UPF0749 family)